MASLAACSSGGTTASGTGASSPAGSATTAKPAGTGSTPGGSTSGTSGTSGTTGTGGTSPTTIGGAATAANAEAFTGSVEDFYVVPDPLPPAPPGSVIRTMPVDAPDGEAGFRIIYHSTDAKGADRAVTGLVFHPTGEAPDGGWPIVAWAHGTSGLAAPCAPSRFSGPPPAFGVKGVRVATDYLGLGPVGEVHPYLSAAAEGHAVIDSVAAARALPDVHAGDEWVVTGVSQGGHAALVTGEQAAARLPSVKLLGTVAIAPGSQLGETYGDDLQARIITMMVLVGTAAEDPDIDLADYLAPDVLPTAEVIRTKCVQDVIGSAAALAANPAFFVSDPRDSALGEEWLVANDPGQVRSDAPILVVQGGQDILVLPARTDALMKRLCGHGGVVERIDVAEGNHDSVTGLAKEQIATWVAARFAGTPADSSC